MSTIKSPEETRRILQGFDDRMATKMLGNTAPEAIKAARIYFAKVNNAIEIARLRGFEPDYFVEFAKQMIAAVAETADYISKEDVQDPQGQAVLREILVFCLTTIGTQVMQFAMEAKLDGPTVFECMAETMDKIYQKQHGN